MTVERTFSIIKPDVVARNLIGDIYHRFENAGLKIIAIKMVHLSRPEARGFYAHLRAKPFFEDIIDFMVSGPVVVQVLEGEDAVRRHREVIGETDPFSQDFSAPLPSDPPGIRLPPPVPA